MTSSIKPEVHNLSPRHQRMTEPRPYHTQKFREYRTCSSEDIIADRQTHARTHIQTDIHAHHNTPLPYRWRSNSGVTIIFAPPANIRYGYTGTQSNNSLDTKFGSLWAPFTVLGPWAPGIKPLRSNSVAYIDNTTRLSEDI